MLSEKKMKNRVPRRDINLSIPTVNTLSILLVGKAAKI